MREWVRQRGKLWKKFAWRQGLARWRQSQKEDCDSLQDMIHIARDGFLHVDSILYFHADYRLNRYTIKARDARMLFPYRGFEFPCRLGLAHTSYVQKNPTRMKLTVLPWYSITRGKALVLVVEDWALKIY